MSAIADQATRRTTSSFLTSCKVSVDKALDCGRDPLEAKEPHKPAVMDKIPHEPLQLLDRPASGSGEVPAQFLSANGCVGPVQGEIIGSRCQGSVHGGFLRVEDFASGFKPLHRFYPLCVASLLAEWGLSCLSLHIHGRMHLSQG